MYYNLRWKTNHKMMQRTEILSM